MGRSPPRPGAGVIWALSGLVAALTVHTVVNARLLRRPDPDAAAAEPDEHARRVGEEIEGARQRVRGDREGRQGGEQVQRAGAVCRAEALHVLNTSFPTHLVQWTPGSAGTMMRAG